MKTVEELLKLKVAMDTGPTNLLTVHDYLTKLINILINKEKVAK